MEKTTKRKKAISGILVSLLVLILLFLAVSTSTYAWYSAINRALGDSITFTSSASDLIGGDLGIGWTSDCSLAQITFDAPHSNLYPMIPKTHAEIGITSYYDFVTKNFNTTAQTYSQPLQKWLASFAGQDVDPYICTGTINIEEEAVTLKHFYLRNKKASEKQTINIRYTIDGTLADMLHVAIFIGDPVEGEEDVLFSNMKLMGIMSSEDRIYYGAIAENDPVEDTPLMIDVYRASNTMTFVMNENSYKCCAMVAWLDGAIIENTHIQQTTFFEITFDGVIGDLSP